MGWGGNVFFVLIVQSQTPNTGIFVYTPAPGAGNLIGSWTAAAGNDPFGNPHPAGVYLAGTGNVLTVQGSNGAEIIAQIIGGIPFLQFPTGAAEEGQAAFLQSLIASPGPSESLQYNLRGPSGNVHVDFVYVNLESATKSGSNAAGGNLVYSDTSAVQHTWLTWGASGIQVRSPIPGDTNTYQTERATVTLGADLPITSATPLQVFNALPIGAGRYKLTGQLVYNPTTTGGTANFQLSGGVAVAAMGVVFKDTVLGSSTVWDTSAVINAFATVYSTSTLGSISTHLCEFSGTLNVSTAGLLGLFASTNGTGAFTILENGTCMQLNPIGT